MIRRGNQIYLTTEEARVLRAGLAAHCRVRLNFDGKPVEFIEVASTPAPAQTQHEAVSEK